MAKWNTVQKALLLTLSRVIDWVTFSSLTVPAQAHVLAAAILVSTFWSWQILRSEPGHCCPPVLRAMSQLAALCELVPGPRVSQATLESRSRAASGAGQHELEMSSVSFFASEGIRGLTTSFAAAALTKSFATSQVTADSGTASGSGLPSRGERRARVMRKLMMAQLPEAIVSAVINFWAMHSGWHELRWYKGLARSSTAVTMDVGAETFDRVFCRSPHHIVRWHCPDCYPSHREVFYKRLTANASSAEFRPYHYFRNNWSSLDNELHKDFDLFSSYNDALAGQDKSRWDYCSLDNPSCGFPGCRSGRKTPVDGQFGTFLLSSSRSAELVSGKAVSFAVEQSLDLHTMMASPGASTVCLHSAATMVALATFAVGIADSVLAFWIQTSFVQSHAGPVTAFYLLEVVSWIPLNLIMIKEATKGAIELLSVDFASIMCLVVVGVYGSVTRHRVCTMRRAVGVVTKVAIQLLFAALLATLLLLGNFLFFDRSSTFRWLNRCYYVVRFVSLVTMLQFFDHGVPSSLAALSLVLALLLGIAVWIVFPRLRLRRELATAAEFNERAVQSEERTRAFTVAPSSPNWARCAPMRSASVPSTYDRDLAAGATSAASAATGTGSEGMPSEPAEASAPAGFSRQVGYLGFFLGFARPGSLQGELGEQGAEAEGASTGDAEGSSSVTHEIKFVHLMNEVGDIFEALLLACRADSPRVRSAILSVAVRPLAEAGPELHRRLLPLILPQLLLSLRWRMVEDGNDEHCSLSCFLLDAILASHDLSLVAMVYWQLFALSTDRKDAARGTYRAVRLRLLACLYAGSFNGRTYDQTFCSAALPMLANQRRLYYQLRLVAKVASRIQVSHTEKTAVLRTALTQVGMLKRWRGQPCIEYIPKPFSARLVEPPCHRCCCCCKRAQPAQRSDIIREEWALDTILDTYEDYELDLSSPNGTSLPGEAGRVLTAIDPTKSFVAHSAAAPVVFCCEVISEPAAACVAGSGGAGSSASAGATSDGGNAGRGGRQVADEERREKEEEGTKYQEVKEAAARRASRSAKRGSEAGIDSAGFSTPSLEGSGERRFYALKFGDDLRQDALVLQIFRLMDTAWAEQGLSEVALDPYSVIAISAREGVVAFVPKAVKVSSILLDHEGNVAQFITRRCPDPSLGFDRLCGSLAGYCVATYLLGIGDRHLDNVMITEEGHFFHIDFGWVFGDDPKPFVPPVRVPREVLAAVQSSGRYEHFRFLVGEAFLRIRRTARLWTSMLSLIASAGGSGINADVDQGLCILRERMHLELEEEEARAEILMELEECAASMVPTIYDKLHQAGLFWN